MATDIEILQLLLSEATLANARTKGRRGSVVHLDADNADDVIFTGDLHGHRDNFKKLVQLADLGNHPRRHLVFQEACHGGPQYPDGSCGSHVVVEQIVALICEYPGRVHFVLGNHELAEMISLPIVKRGRLLNIEFRRGLMYKYGDAGQQIEDMIIQWFWTCPIAVRWNKKVLFTHSIPDKCYREAFDFTVFDRFFELADIVETGSIHKMVWGRDFTPQNSEYFAMKVQADVLINGHEPCLGEGFKTYNGNRIIIDCCDDNPAYILANHRTPCDNNSFVEAVCYL